MTKIVVTLVLNKLREMDMEVELMVVVETMLAVAAAAAAVAEMKENVTLITHILVVC